MNGTRLRSLGAGVGMFAIFATGCTRISVDPTCPEELAVGEAGTVAANARDAGAAPDYLWEVFPETAGTFADATRPTTTFTPDLAGDAIIRLTASDQLFQVVTQCVTHVADVAVTLAPTCPGLLNVGQSGPVQANEQNATDTTVFTWEVSPADAGTFTDPNSADTRFEPTQAGEAVLQITAVEGSSEVVAECATTVQAVAGVAVELSIDPNPPVVGQEAVLTCTSVGEVAAVVLSVAEVDGDTVTPLDVDVPGVAPITPTTAGEMTFSCVGAALTGDTTEPLLLTVTVEPAPDGGGTDRGGKG